MTSGVTLNPACLEVYQDFKIKSTKDPKSIKDDSNRRKEYKYIIFNLNKENTEIVVEEASLEAKTEEKDEAKLYDDFVGSLPENECRWAVYDLVYEKEGGTRKKIVLFSWTPDTAKIKQKMLFASSFDVLRRSLVGVAFEVQATDLGEVALDTILEKLERVNRR